MTESQKQYIKDNLHKSNKNLSRELGVGYMAIKHFLYHNHILRTPEQIQTIRDEFGRTHRGSNNGYWKGGISKDNYHYKKLQVERYPERIKARQIAESAIRAGKLIKERCLITNSDNVVAHHENYNYPLLVVWLSPRIHRDYHNNKLDVQSVQKIKIHFNFLLKSQFKNVS